MSAPFSIPRLDARRDDFRAALSSLRARLGPRGDIVSAAGKQRTIEVFGEPLTPAEVVERICRDVRDGGIAAVLDYARRIDQADLTAATIRVPEEELAAAHRGASPELLATIDRVRRNIHEFQSAILHRDVELARADGAKLRQRYVPLARVGVCVPGGAAAYPSTVLMTVVPAQVAGVREIAVVAPPTKFGAYSPDLLATCHALGVREVYRLGGAQAVAALAYGVEGVPAVDMIVGPGNLFVALAKKFVYGEVDIDSIAGPSEVVVVADETASPEFVASDLIAQAEHSPAASVLVSWHAPLLDAVAEELARQLAGLERGDLAGASLAEYGALIEAADRAQAAAVADDIAPEHLHLQVRDPQEMLARIRCAGAAFLGPYTPVALGDYVAGPSHVLPTGGTARFASGLSANDFLRPMSVIEYTRDALADAAADVRELAVREGLTAHWASVERRLRDDS